MDPLTFVIFIWLMGIIPATFVIWAGEIDHPDQTFQASRQLRRIVLWPLALLGLV